MFIVLFLTCVTIPISAEKEDTEQFMINTLIAKSITKFLVIK